MRLEDIHADIRDDVFEFFYWFSRFEFALKENNFLRSAEEGAPAEPGWDMFVQRYRDQYAPSQSARKLITLNPQRQIIGKHRTLDWKDVDNSGSELDYIVRLLKTVRNNLFHGGKHGAKGWDDPARTKELITTGKIVLDELAREANITSDYTQYY